jgi:myxalamid-type polyketide synthase MxaB
MAVRAGHSDDMQSRGMGLIPADKGMEVLARALEDSLREKGDRHHFPERPEGGFAQMVPVPFFPPANLAVMDARWPEIQRAMRGRRPSLLRDVTTEEAAAPAQAKDAQVDRAFREKLLAVGAEERTSLLRDYFSGELARIMGIEASQLDAQQPLNTLGLDSLMAIELKNNMEARLAITLPMARFLEGPSIASLADCAAELVAGAGGGDSAPDQPSGAADTHAAAPKTAASPAPQVWSPLVTLSRAGTRPPLFLLHAAGGDVRCYYELARAMTERPVHALRAHGFEPGQEPHRSLRAMALDYLAALRAVQPEGPYHLAGWSAGGVFAYELARLLEEQGTPPASLVLIDTPLPSIYEGVDPNDDVRFLRDLVSFSNRAVAANMQVSLDQLQGLDREARFQFALEEAKRQGVLPADVSADYIRRFVEVCRAHVQAIMDYRVMPIGISIELVRPTETGVLAEASGKDLAHDLGWGGVASKLTLHSVPGDHFTMLAGENASRLADVVMECVTP